MTERKVGPSRGNAGKGRVKGVPNKVTGQLKDMILEALGQSGGVDYLVSQARDNPTAFMSLVGRVLPLQVNAELEAGPKMAKALTWLPTTE